MLSSKGVRTTYGFVWEAVLELKGELAILDNYFLDEDPILAVNIIEDSKASIRRAIESLESSLSQL